MIAAWILYASFVGILWGGGAMALETLLRAHRLPTRGLWVGAMVLSVLWPLSQLLWRRVPTEVAPGPSPDPSWIVALEPLAVQVGPESALRTLDQPLLLVWLCSSVVLLALALLLLLRTWRLRKEWVGEEAVGRAVLLSEEWGPAVVGFLRPQIVLPRWCRELREEALRLILVHEAEHLRAGDLRLLLLVGALPILLPWSLPIWWQLARLRVAVEGDCDLRVLQKHPNQTRSYLELLLEVGGRVPRRQVAATMLSEPGETLERRIRIMTMPFPKNPWRRGVLLAGLGGMLVALACSAPSPDTLDEADTPLSMEIPPDAANDPGPEASAAPAFTPFTVRPQIQNRQEVVDLLEKEYPPLLRKEGVGGMALVWVYIDEEGVVRKVQLDKSTGNEALDRAALKVVAETRFSPALDHDKPVPVWVSFPVTFATDGGGSRLAGVGTPGANPTGGEERTEVAEMPPRQEDLPLPPRVTAEGYDTESIADAPTFTPYTVPPTILNRDEITRAQEDAYPRELRDEGIGGTANVWFLIDETGVVRRTLIGEGSGHDLLDNAALKVAETIEFSPALNRDKTVPVWISLPITFTRR
jgi:TonB family protein